MQYRERKSDARLLPYSCEHHSGCTTSLTDFTVHCCVSFSFFSRTHSTSASCSARFVRFMDGTKRRRHTHTCDIPPGIPPETSTHTHTHTIRHTPSISVQMRELGREATVYDAGVPLRGAGIKGRVPKHRQSKASAPVAVKRASSTPSSILSTLHLFSIGRSLRTAPGHVLRRAPLCAPHRRFLCRAREWVCAETYQKVAVERTWT